MKKISILLLFVGCTLPPVSSTPEPVPSPSPTVDIAAMAKNFACAKYRWKDRGVLNANYFALLATSYHKAWCSKEPGLSLGSATSDALAHYGKEANLRNTYTLLIGLGARESSGKACTGKDASADNATAFTAEAGMYQFSYNTYNSPALSAPQIAKLHSIYESHQKTCKPVACTDPIQSKNYGTGAGAIFQKFTKECPDFAVEYAAYLIRVYKNHFGPLKRKEAEFKQECNDLLASVEQVACP